MKNTITSMDEFERKYFPKHYEEKSIKNMTPEETGKYMAKKSIEKFKLKLKRIL